MDRLSPRLVDALNDQLELWARWAADAGPCSSSPLAAAIDSRTPSAAGSRPPVNEDRALRIEAAMTAIKREAPDQYRVLKVEAWGLRGDAQLREQKDRVRSLKISTKTYCKHLQRGRLFLAGLLFWPAINRELERSA